MYDKWPRPLEERHTGRRTTRRGRDKVTGTPDGKRWCPAYEGLISAVTCRESRGKIKNCDARCPYFAPLIVSSGTRRESPNALHKCYLRHVPTSGVATVLISRKNPDGTLRLMTLLLDLWKVGIQDCFVDVRMVEDLLAKQLAKEVPPFAEASLEDCQKLVKWAERISREVGREIPWEYERWNDMLGDIGKVPDIDGSLYKCAKCGDNLPQKAIDLMKRYALRADMQFYMVCRKCGGEYDDSW